nr:MAG TPA: hypothetical protein [Caudoviricetes sp.]
MRNLFKEVIDSLKQISKGELMLIIVGAITVIFLGGLEQREKDAVRSVLSGEVTLISSQSTDTLSCTCKTYKKAYICSCRNTDIGVILEDDPNHLSVEDTEKALTDYHHRKQRESDEAIIFNQHLLDGAASMTR